MNRFADLKGEIPAELYEHVRMIHHLSAFSRDRDDPASLIRVVNDLQPLGKQKALEVLRAYERLAGDGILAMKEEWKEGEDGRKQARAMRYGIDAYDERLLPIPGLLFVGKDGKPIRGLSVSQPTPEDGDKPPYLPMMVSDDIPFVAGFIDGMGGQGPDIENDLSRVEEEMRIRPTLLQPKGDPLSAAEALLRSPRWAKLFQDASKPDEQNRQHAALAANAVRLQVMRMTRQPSGSPRLSGYEDEEISALWKDCLKRPELRALRWDTARQEFSSPGQR